ncbi:MAG: hypothetical protein ACR2RA_22605, partial [Geminicoccaceae bacterium]
MTDTDRITARAHADPAKVSSRNGPRHPRSRSHEENSTNAVAKHRDRQDHSMHRQRIIRGNDITGFACRSGNLFLTFACHARFPVQGGLGGGLRKKRGEGSGIPRAEGKEEKTT